MEKHSLYVYDGQHSRDFLSGWTVTHDSSQTAESNNRHCICYQDPKTQLEITCEITKFADFPALEWVLYFKNKGGEDTPILEYLFPLDVILARRQAQEFILHRILGSVYDISEFSPSRFNLIPHTQRKLSCVGGRSSNGGDETRIDGTFPFFDLEFDGGGSPLELAGPASGLLRFNGMGIIT